MRKGLVLAVAVLFGLVPAAWAQIASGNLYGTILDESGAVLPGATITLSGDLGTRSTIAGSQGEFRILNLDHGTYKVTVALTGFTTVTRNVVVQVGSNVDLRFSLKLATVAETITVEAQTPLVDTKKVGTATTISRDELSRMPSSRDPWALMRTAGILVDRVNVAGSESGQQSAFVGKGADPKDSVWSMDGVVITDMAAIGASPTYFTYDSFDEVNFSTAGNDMRVATGGVGVGLVTKRGTNAFHGNVGGYFTHDKLQWSNLPPELRGDPRLVGSDKADHSDQIADYSADFGGPIVKGKLWFYGSYGKNDIRIRRLTQTRDKTVLKNYTAKLNWQASPNDMVSFFWFLGQKVKIGRAGAAGGLQHLDGTLWDQGGQYPRHPHGLSKLEWNHVFGPKFLLDGKAAYYSTGFTLFPQGGLSSSLWVLDFAKNEAHGTSDARIFERPNYTLQLDGNYFASGLGGSHELKFGLGWRKVTSSSGRTNPGQKVQARIFSTFSRARFYRDALSVSEGQYENAYLQDTFTKDRLTLNLGLRFDRQTSRKARSSVPGNPLLPSLLPALDYAGDSSWPVKWNDVSPRVGLTLALDEARKTVARASFARYAGQLPNTQASWNNPLATSYVEYNWTDTKGDRIVQPGGVDFSAIKTSSNIDPNNPSAVGQSPNQIDPKFHSNKDNEFVLGIDREFAPNLAVSAAYTWRRSTDLTATQLLSGSYWYSWIGVTSADYHRGAPVTKNGFTAVPYVLNDGVAKRVTGGALLTNRPDFTRTFKGAELAIAKRLSNNWMGRVSLGYNDWSEHVGPAGIVNPSHRDLDPQFDGGQVMNRSGGSGKIYYTSAKWQFNVNGLYQLPAGFEIAANLFGRQGYPRPFYLRLDTGALDGVINVLAVSQVDQTRLPNLWNLDLRLAKNLKAGGVNINASVECFNALNGNTELWRVVDASSATAFNRLDEILSPRIVRFGLRLTF